MLTYDHVEFPQNSTYIYLRELTSKLSVLSMVNLYLNSCDVQWEKRVEIINTLHVKCFPFGFQNPNETATVNFGTFCL